LGDSGVETGGSGGSMNRASEHLPPESGAKKIYVRKEYATSENFGLPVLALGGRPRELRAPGYCCTKAPQSLATPLLGETRGRKEPCIK